MSMLGSVESRVLQEGPLSQAQEQIWLFERLNPGNTCFQIINALTIPGPLAKSHHDEIALLEFAINAVIARQPSLRTAIFGNDATAFQSILSSARLKLHSADFSDIDDSEIETATAKFVKDELAKPFDLSVPPLMRCALVRCGPQKRILLSAVHHIVFDGASYGIFFGELLALFRSFASGSISALEPLPRSYIDFARAERTRAAEHAPETAAYVARVLSGASPYCQLPYALRKHASLSRAGYRSFWITEPRRGLLWNAARGSGVSMFMLFVAAVATLLWRHTGQRDLLFATPVTNRRDESYRNLMGLFVDNVLLRIQLEPHWDFATLLKHVRKVTLAAQAHGALPADAVARALRGDGSLNAPPQPNIVVAMDDTAVERVRQSEGKGDEIKRRAFASGGVAADLRVMVSTNLDPDKTSVTLEYDANIFEPGIIEHLVLQLNAIIDGFVADPSVGLAQLPLPEAEAEPDDFSTDVVDSAMERVPDSRRGDLMQLSPVQDRILFQEQLGDFRGGCNVPLSLRLKGALDTPRLSEGLRNLVRSHEVLRTRLTIVQGIAFQQVSPCDDFAIALEEMAGLSIGERDRFAQLAVREEASRPFEVIGGGLFRARLLRFSEDDHLLLVTAHQLIADSSSLGIILNEVETAYGSGSGPTSSDELQYMDYLAWQHSEAQNARILRQVRYWWKQLEGASPLVELPFDRPRPENSTYVGDTVSFSLGRSGSRELVELARCQGVSLLVLLSAAFQVLLARWSGEADILLGVSVSGRAHRAAQRMIGPMENMTVIRSDLSKDTAFTDLLPHVERTTRAALANQDVPFELLVAKTQSTRDQHRYPIVQVMISLQKTPDRGSGFSGLETYRMSEPPTGTMLDLSLHVQEGPEGIGGFFRYSTELFDKPSIESLADQWKVLLEGIVADPSRRISRLPLITQQQRRVLIEEFNDTDVRRASRCLLPDLIAAQASESCARIAVQSDGICRTYRQLDERSNQFANHLRERGVKAGEIVGVHLERSFELIVTLLGILKAGAAYLPLAGGLPDERLEYMIRDSAASFLVTQSSLSANWITGSDVAVIVIEDEQDQIDLGSSQPPSSTIREEDLAYVIYTSGSTGRPKGVRIKHLALANFLLAMQGRLQPTSHDVFAAITPISFDIAGLEIWLPFICGAQVALARREVTESGIELARFLEKSAATIVQATPSSWQMLMDSGWKGMPGVKALCGGESLTPKVAEFLTGTCDEAWNLYGPTETTIWSTAKRLASEDTPRSIGRPLDNTKIYILDANHELLPIGTRGELWIGGQGVAAGYIGLEELNNDRFRKDPFRDAGEKIYRTGDLGRWRHDGRLEIFGRIDDQIKIRGHRIEPEEIAAVLMEHPAVARAVVIARESEATGTRLAAYIVPKSRSGSPAGSPLELPNLDTDALRAHARRLLPEYMMPFWYVPLSEIPLTPNGKLDRGALPVPPEQAGRPEYAAPEGPTEIALAAIWSELLRVDRVGRRDSFFRLGGHSLLATRVIAQVRDTFGMELPLRALFNAPVLEDLAVLIENGCSGNQRSSGTSLVNPIRRDGGTSGKSTALLTLREGTGRRVVLFPALGGGFGCYTRLIEELDKTTAIYGVDIASDKRKFSSLVELVASVAGRLTPDVRVAGACLAGWSFGGALAFETARQLLSHGIKLAPLVLIDAAAGSIGAPGARTPEHIWDRFRFDLDIEAGQNGRGEGHGHSPDSRGPAALDARAIDEMYGIYRNSLELLDGYEAKPLDVDAILFRAMPPDPAVDPLLKTWRDLIGGRLVVCGVNASHHGILADGAAEVAAEVDRYLSDLLLPMDG